MTKYIIYNGSIISEDDLQVSPLNRGMMYGDGCFDTLRTYKGKFFKLEEHFERVVNSADYLGINVPFSFQDFRHVLIEFLEKSNLMDEDVLIRIQCWRDGDRGYYTDSTNAQWITSCARISPFNDSIHLSSVDVRAIPSEALERKFKLSNSISYIQAARQANRLGADDALMLTMSNKVSETTRANIFWIKGTSVFTPSKTCDLLPGITRNAIIDVLKGAESFDVTEGEFELDYLKEAEAVFVTNSVREVVAITSIDGIRFNTNHPSITIIRDSFEKFKLQNLE